MSNAIMWPDKVTTEQIDAYWDWARALPGKASETAQSHPPNTLYRLSSTDHRVFIISYAEDGTVTVAVTGEWNLVEFERRVFGIKPEELTPCEKPPPDEPLGVMLNEEEQLLFMNDLRKSNGLAPVASLDELKVRPEGHEEVHYD